MFNITDVPYLPELASVAKGGMKNNFYINPTFLMKHYSSISLISYRLLFVILRIINDTVPYSGVIQLNLKTVNKYALSGEKFNANSLVKGVKELSLQAKDADGNVTKPFILSKLSTGIYCVNPEFVCNEDMYDQASRYADLEEYEKEAV